MRTLIPLEEPREVTDLYVWSFPGAPIQIHLCLDVIDSIRAHLKQGAEAGDSASAKGLLLGRIIAPGLPEITGFKPLPTGSPAELEQAVAAFKSPDLRPLGYFRSHAGDRLTLSPDDLSLAQTHFSDPNCVLLLIQTSDAAALNAGFFYWDRGKMNGGFHDFCFLEFPFDVSLLSPAKPGNSKEDSQLPNNSEPVKPPPQTEAATPLPPEITPTPAGPPESLPAAHGNTNATAPLRRFWRTVRLAVAAVFLAVAGFVAGIFLTQKLAWIVDGARSAESTPIALKAEYQGSDLSVTWNHNSPVVTHAETGRLTIYDGGAREFALDQNHIRYGSVVYSPVSDQVRIQLDLKTPDQRITSESVMVILNKPTPTDSSVVIQPAQIPLQHSFDAAHKDTRTATPTGPLPDSARVRTTREFVPPQARAEVPPDLAPPPPVTAINLGPTAVVSSALALPRSQPPPAPAPKIAVAADTGPPTSPRPSGRLSDIVPPVPIRQRVPPPLTPAQRSFLTRTVLVDIKVFIDASGNVRKTEPLTHTNPALVSVARSAAQLWIFHPARRGGQDIPSEMILQFKFDPPK
jgi:hypothetical protein